MTSVLPHLACTWLDVSDIQPGPPVTLAFRGVAGNVQAARGEIGQALAGARLAGATTRFADVATIIPAGCSALDTFRGIRNAGSGRISAARTRYELSILTEGNNVGALGVQVPITIDTSDSADFALAAIQPSGDITPLLLGRAALQEQIASGNSQISDIGGGRYSITIDVTHNGWSGFLLLTGTGPFDAALIAPNVGERGPNWQQQFRSAASAGNWQGNMLWIQTLDQQPD
jgi:serine/threonine-protein kinase